MKHPILRYLEQNHESLRSLADRSGIDVSQLSRATRGKEPLSVRAMHLLVRATDGAIRLGEVAAFEKETFEQKTPVVMVHQLSQVG